MKKNKTFKTFLLAPEGHQKGALLWLQLLYNHWNPLFQANLLTVLSLTPAYFCVNLLTAAGDMVFWIAALVLFTLAGPSIVGLNSVCARIVLGMPVWTRQDFLTVWKTEWKKSMLITASVGVLWSALIYAVYLVYLVDGGFSIWMLLFFILCAYLLTGLSTFAWMQAAMLELTFSQILKNAFLMIFAGGGRSVWAIALSMLLVSLCLLLYEFAYLILLIGYLSVVSMSFHFVFAPVFQTLFLTENPDEEETR